VEFLAAVAAITSGVLLLVGGLPDARKVKRELARARIQRIDTLGDGEKAAIRGTVTPIVTEGTVTSPLTQREGVYWLVVFEEVGAGGDYRELGRSERGVPFLLCSDAGTARVVLDRPRVALPGRTITRPVLEPGAIGELLRSAGGKRPNHATSSLRATEYVLDVGAFITVSGWATREPNPEASDSVSGYREQLPTRPVISGTRRAKLMIG
jgi:hypothetical protein